MLARAIPPAGDAGLRCRTDGVIPPPLIEIGRLVPNLIGNLSPTQSPRSALDLHCLKKRLGVKIVVGGCRLAHERPRTRRLVAVSKSTGIMGKSTGIRQINELRSRGVIAQKDSVFRFPWRASHKVLRLPYLLVFLSLFPTRHIAIGPTDLVNIPSQFGAKAGVLHSLLNPVPLAGWLTFCVRSGKGRWVCRKLI